MHLAQDRSPDIIPEIKRSDEKAIDAGDSSNVFDSLERGLCLDLDDGQERAIGVLQVVGQGLVGESLGREGRAEAAVALGREFGGRDEALGVGDGVDEGNDYAMGAGVEGACRGELMAR